MHNPVSGACPATAQDLTTEAKIAFKAGVNRLDEALLLSAPAVPGDTA
jgi:hypothetical protein